jgi:drug/metabolite transporter (DMT)-like permease
MQPWQSQGRPDLVGFGMTVLAGMSYGLGWAYIKRFLGRSDFGGLTLPASQMLTSLGQILVIVTIWWLTQRTHLSLAAPWSLHANTTGGSALLPALAILALGVFGTGLAMSFQFDVLRAAGPTVAASVTYLIPVVSVALGVLVLDERLQWPQFAGAAVVLVAAVLIGWPGRRQPGHR